MFCWTVAVDRVSVKVAIRFL